MEGFFCTALAPSRCRCILDEGRVVAALYWLDTHYAGQRFAYLYAVAVAKSHRGRGLCKELILDTHTHLTLRGYDGVLLVPQEEGLRKMYEKMGYRDATSVDEFPAQAGDTPVTLQRIDREEYARLRKVLLPAGSAVEKEESIAFLETMAFFYRGENLLLAAHAVNGKLWCPEFLGSRSEAPAVLAALRCTEGHFRTPGSTFPFAMFLPLEADAQVPCHLALAFD